MLDIGYDVVVKFLAAQILLLAAFVAAPYLKGLGAALARHAAERSPHAVAAGALHRWNQVARLTSVLAACLLVWWTYRTAESVSVNFARSPAQTPLHGIWDVEQVTRAGVDLPLLVTDRTLWRRLVLPWGGPTQGRCWFGCPTRSRDAARRLTRRQRL
jgi:hypothetical protein